MCKEQPWCAAAQTKRRIAEPSAKNSSAASGPTAAPTYSRALESHAPRKLRIAAATAVPLACRVRVRVRVKVRVWVSRAARL